jgi:hypothetical protein
MRKYTVTDSEIAHACVEAILLWADPRYQQYLGNGRINTLDAAWFKRFVGDWSVARLIGEGNQDAVRKYLESTLRISIDSTGASAVDAAAQYIQDRKWSSRYGKKKKGFRNPLSLVSKIGFVLAPNRIAPLDIYSSIGLRRILKISRRGDAGEFCGRYAKYLVNFDRAFSMYQDQIKQELSSRWVQELSPKLGCSRASLALPEFRRKVFDNLLMRIGRRRAAKQH